MIEAFKDAFRQRQDRWREGWMRDLSLPANRFSAHFDMMMFDHGVLRLGWRNLHEFAPGVWRSNQPSPVQFRDLQRRGIRTVVNLRGPSLWGSYVLEKEICAELGMRLVDARLYSRMPPTPEEVEALFEVFETAERPLVMHCKSGADRAGLGAALYLLWEGRPPDEAARQLSLRYLHIRRAKTGVLDAFIAAFGRAHAARGIGFRDWLHTEYDKGRIMEEFDASRLGNFVVERVLNRE